MTVLDYNLKNLLENCDKCDLYYNKQNNEVMFIINVDGIDHIIDVDFEFGNDTDYTHGLIDLKNPLWLFKNFVLSLTEGRYFNLFFGKLNGVNYVVYRSMMMSTEVKPLNNYDVIPQINCHVKPDVAYYFDMCILALGI